VPRGAFRPRTLCFLGLKAPNRCLPERFLQIDKLLPLNGQVKLMQRLYLEKRINREDLAQVMEEVKMRRLFAS